MKRLTMYTNNLVSLDGTGVGRTDKDRDESCPVFDAPLYVGDPADGMNPDFLNAAVDMFERHKIMADKPKDARKFMVVEQEDE